MKQKTEQKMRKEDILKDVIPKDYQLNLSDFALAK